MARPITLFTGQWADLPFTEVCQLASRWGYDGLEIACWGDHLDVARGASDDAYLAERKSPHKAIVAFSGEHEYGGRRVTEVSLNGFPSNLIPEKIVVPRQFEPRYRLLRGGL